MAPNDVIRQKFLDRDHQFVPTPMVGTRTWRLHNELKTISIDVGRSLEAAIKRLTTDSGEFLEVTGKAVGYRIPHRVDGKIVQTQEPVFGPTTIKLHDTAAEEGRETPAGDNLPLPASSSSMPQSGPGTGEMYDEDAEDEDFADVDSAVLATVHYRGDAELLSAMKEIRKDTINTVHKEILAPFHQWQFRVDSSLERIKKQEELRLLLDDKRRKLGKAMMAMEKARTKFQGEASRRKEKKLAKAIKVHGKAQGDFTRAKEAYDNHETEVFDDLCLLLGQVSGFRVFIAKTIMLVKNAFDQAMSVNQVTLTNEQGVSMQKGQESPVPLKRISLAPALPATPDILDFEPVQP
eukprot:jgi/Mesvir1/23077/Mv10002-RA.1